MKEARIALVGLGHAARDPASHGCAIVSIGDNLSEILATERGRKTRPDIKLGICGEHGGDPRSIQFCHDLGLDYVSCSPFRVPVARIAAAQARVRRELGL